jgi:predicted short-subunit dehydrogenase-like oxidoreductase (DUF2520 family)
MNMNLLDNKIVLLGAGNVATQLGIAFRENGFPVVQVYSRSLASAEALGKRLQTAYTDNLLEINGTANIYIFALKDSALPQVLKELPPFQGLYAHTAGSLPLAVFSDYSERKGVLYPLQTLSKNRDISFRNLPFFVEANSPEDEFLLEEIALKLSGNVTRLSSEKRKYLHLAAVFACNFTNHLYTLATQILEEQGLDRRLLLPLIRETVSKIETMHPQEAQTGPAVRYDKNVIDKHLEMLEAQAHLQELYQQLSEDIHAIQIAREQFDVKYN